VVLAPSITLPLFARLISDINQKVNIHEATLSNQVPVAKYLRNGYLGRKPQKETPEGKKKAPSFDFKGLSLFVMRV